MKSVDLYKKEIAITKVKVCNPQTFVNQKRWMQDFKVVS